MPVEFFGWGTLFGTGFKREKNNTGTCLTNSHGPGHALSDPFDSMYSAFKHFRDHCFENMPVHLHRKADTRRAQQPDLRIFEPLKAGDLVGLLTMIAEKSRRKWTARTGVQSWSQFCDMDKWAFLANSFKKCPKNACQVNQRQPKQITCQVAIPPQFAKIRLFSAKFRQNLPN